MAPIASTSDNRYRSSTHATLKIIHGGITFCRPKRIPLACRRCFRTSRWR